MSALTGQAARRPVAVVARHPALSGRRVTGTPASWCCDMLVAPCRTRSDRSGHEAPPKRGTRRAGRPGGGRGDVHGTPGDGGCRHDASTAVSRLDEQQPTEGLHHHLSKRGHRKVRRRHHRRPLQDGQPEAHRQSERRGKREDPLLHQRRDARLPGECERYSHIWQQPRHLLDVVHPASVTCSKARTAWLGDHTAGQPAWRQSSSACGRIQVYLDACRPWWRPAPAEQALPGPEPTLSASHCVGDDPGRLPVRSSHVSAGAAGCGVAA